MAQLTADALASIVGGRNLSSLLNGSLTENQIHFGTWTTARMRRLTPHINPDAKAALDLLADQRTAPDAYREAFYRLGQFLAQRLKRAGLGRKTSFACTSEDADFLARGIFESINKPEGSHGTPVAFACFWQARFDPAREQANKKRFEVAPIVKRYEEPIDDVIDSLIVAKSIIATSCVIRHALLDAIERKHPEEDLCGGSRDSARSTG